MLKEVKKCLLASLDQNLVDSLLDHYKVVQAAFLIGDYEKAVTRSGKFVEVVLKCLHHLTTTPNNFPTSIEVGKEIMRLENLPKNSTESSFRLHIPRACRTVYSIRSDRGIVHDSSKIDPNYMDATVVVSIVNWILSELVRATYVGNPNTAQNLVNHLVQGIVPLVEEINGDLIPLNKNLSARQAIVLLLLKRHPHRIFRRELYKWLEIYYSKTNLNVTINNLRKSQSIHLTDQGIKLTKKGLHEIEEEIKSGLGVRK
jgi:hypothetical protein